MPSLADVLHGLAAGASGFTKGYYDQKDRIAKEERGKEKSAMEREYQQMRMAELLHRMGSEDRKLQSEREKTIEKARVDIGQVANLQKQFDEYVDALSHTVDGNYILRNIPYTDANKYWNQAQNVKGRIIGKLSQADNLGKTQGILKFFDEKMDVKSQTALKGMQEAFNSQLQNIVLAEADKAGLTREDGLQLFRNAFKNQFGPAQNNQLEEQPTAVQEEDAPLSEKLKQNRKIAPTPIEKEEEPPTPKMFGKGSPGLKERLSEGVRDTFGAYKGLIDNDITKGFGEGLGHVGKQLLKFLTPNIEGTEGYPHEHINRAAGLLQDDYRKKVQFKDPDSIASKAGRFAGEVTGLVPLTATGLPGVAGAISSGASMGMLEEPDNLLEGGIKGGAAGGVLHGVLKGIASLPQKAKKWWVKWSRGNPHNDLKTAERLSEYFTGDEVSLGQVLDSPKTIQMERTMGHVPFSGESKTVDHMIKDLDHVSEKIAATFEKDPKLVSKEIQTIERKLNKTAKEMYEKALGTEAKELVLSPKDVNELISNNYPQKPDIMQKIKGEKTLSNEQVEKKWREASTILQNLWNSGNKDSYVMLYKDLRLPNFWDLHWFQSDLKKTALKLAKNPMVESNTRAGLHNDETLIKHIIDNYTNKKEYQAATDLYRDVVAPFKNQELFLFNLEADAGKKPSFRFFEKGGKDAKKVYDRLSDKGKKAVLADVIDPQAEQLSLRSFPEIKGNRGNKAKSKAEHLLTKKEKHQFEDYGQLNRMLTDLQPEQKSPKTGYAVLKAAKNPVAAALTIGSHFLNPAVSIGAGSGMAANRLLSKSLRNRKNLKYYLKPELLDEIIKKKKIKQLHRLPMQLLNTKREDK